MKSSYSEPQENCVEVEKSWAPGVVGVSHSKHPDGPTLEFTHDEWTAFIQGVKDGEFDLTG